MNFGTMTSHRGGQPEFCRDRLRHLPAHVLAMLDRVHARRNLFVGQRDGRLTVDGDADAVAIAVDACHLRVRALHSRIDGIGRAPSPSASSAFPWPRERRSVPAPSRRFLPGRGRLQPAQTVIKTRCPRQSDATCRRFSPRRGSCRRSCGRRTDTPCRRDSSCRASSCRCDPAWCGCAGPSPG